MKAAYFQLLQDVVDIIIPAGNLRWLPVDEGVIGIAGYDHKNRDEHKKSQVLMLNAKCSMITAWTAMMTQWSKVNPWSCHSNGHKIRKRETSIASLFGALPYQGKIAIDSTAYTYYINDVW